MLFTIEALDASEGDCLLLLHGDPAAPSIIVIDGGPARTLARSLRPRLRELARARGLGEREPLPIELAVLTHIDDDHIGGLLGLVDAIVEARDARQPAIATIAELWHNSFDDVVGDDQVGDAMAILEALPLVDEHGTLAGTRQGRLLRDAARKLGIAVNAPFDRLVARPDDGVVVIEGEGDDGLRLVVLGPSRAELAAYQAQWDRDIKAGRAGEVAGVDLDSSAFNLSSIMVMAECGARRALLTGDGRGDHLLAGLVAGGYLSADGDDTFHVDVFKLPHHGSCRNLTPEVLRRVSADTYIISANGKHQNPDLETLKMLAEARGDAPYTLILTFPEGAYADLDPVVEAERRAVLEGIDGWLRACPEGHPTIIYRERDALGVSVVLGDETCG